MKIKKAKENIINNFRANYSDESGVFTTKHDIEVFLLNTMENLQLVVTSELRKEIIKMIKDNTAKNVYRDGETAFDIVQDINKNI